MAEPATIVKVGGSLYDLPDLGPRLSRWLDACSSPVMLVPGGGSFAAAVRELDRIHQLGEERAHWLAIQAMSQAARFLATLLPRGELALTLAACPAISRAGQIAVLDVASFCAADERLPHSWDVTSDAIAARIAQVSGARRLILLKSVGLEGGLSWQEAARRGLVDPAFADVIAAAPALAVELIDFRAAASVETV